MNPLAPGLSYLDTHFQNVPHVIATVVAQGDDGIALLDPGPTTTLPAIERELGAIGASLADVSALLLTHIHLDHAGASGTLVRRHPRIKVYVHENGAPHLAAPEKLLASATRLYGDAMDRLWGEFLPVPAEALVTLKGGETIQAGGRALEVAYTPGHASHHVSYFDRADGIAFVGDTAGVKVGSFVLPPTPPPDIDLEVWRTSAARIAAWQAGTLFLTHFGPSSPVAAHLDELADHLDLVGRLSKDVLARPGTDEAQEQWFVEEIRRELLTRMPQAEVDAYEVAGRFDLSFRGLARYWRKKNR